MQTRREILVSSSAFCLVFQARGVQARAVNGIVEVPFSFDGRGKPTIQASFGPGQTYAFGLDTGAAVAVIRADLATRLHLLVVDGGEVTGLSRGSNGSIFQASNVRLGGTFTVPSIQFFVSVAAIPRCGSALAV